MKKVLKQKCIIIKIKFIIINTEIFTKNSVITLYFSRYNSNFEHLM